MRPIAILTALLATAPAMADTHYVLMKDPTNVPPEVQELLIRSYRVFTLGRLAESIELQQEALRVHRQIVGNDSPELIGTLEGLVDPQIELKQYAAAMETCREMRRLAALNFSTSDYRVRSAEVAIRQVERQSKLSEEDRQALKIARRDLGNALSEEIQKSAKRSHLESAYSIYRKRLGSTCCESRMSRMHLCNTLIGLRQFDQAIAVILGDLDAMRNEYGAEHPFYALDLAMLSITYHLNEQDDLAIRHGQVAADIYQATDCSLEQSALLMHSALVQAYVRQKRYAEAEAIGASLVRQIEAHPPIVPEILSTALLALSSVYVAQENHQKAGLILERLVTLRREDESGEAVNVGEAERLLATSYMHLERFTDAEPLLRHAIIVFENQREQAAKQQRLILCHHQLGECLVRQNRWEEAIPSLETAHRKLHASRGTSAERTRKVRDDLAAALRAVGREADATRLTVEPRPFPAVAELSTGNQDE